MSKKTVKIVPPEFVLKNTIIKDVEIKISWEPCCRQLVTLKFDDPDGSMTTRYEDPKREHPPYFTIPYFKGEQANGASYIGAALLSLAWVVDNGMYLDAVGKYVRVQWSKGRVIAVGNIIYERWIYADDLLEIPYPYCLNKPAK